MGRLTKYGEDGRMRLSTHKDEYGNEIIVTIDGALRKLAHYEDMEEQGRLVEVVRCKDCDHYDTQNCGEGAGWCKVFNAGRFDDWYCSSAKLKELEGVKE